MIQTQSRVLLFGLQNFIDLTAKKSINPVKITPFKQANHNIGVNQVDGRPAVAFLDPLDNVGNVTTCWKMSPFDRLRALITGRVFLTVQTYHLPLQPLSLSTTFDGPDQNQIL